MPSLILTRAPTPSMHPSIRRRHRSGFASGLAAALDPASHCCPLCPVRRHTLPPSSMMLPGTFPRTSLAPKPCATARCEGGCTACKVDGD